ncbi:MAG: hypothetical protein SOI60_10155 [Lachnospiraceae bacterium]|jgi:hypothetical protein
MTVREETIARKIREAKPKSAVRVIGSEVCFAHLLDSLAQRPDLVLEVVFDLSGEKLLVRFPAGCVFTRYMTGQDLNLSLCAEAFGAVRLPGGVS